MASLVALVLFTGALTGCQDAFTLPHSNVDYCTIIADPPIKDGKHIDGRGHYRCDGQGASTITMTVMLQKQNSKGSWITLSRHTSVAHGINTTRHLSDSQRTRKTSAGCSNGQFRSYVRAVERSHGHSQTYTSHSVTVPNPCHVTF